MELVHSCVGDFSEFFTIVMHNQEVAKYHFDGFEWSKMDYASNKWVKIEGGVNPLQIAKDMAKENNYSLQFVVDTACGVIVSTIL